MPGNIINPESQNEALIPSQEKNLKEVKKTPSSQEKAQIPVIMPKETKTGNLVISSPQKIEEKKTVSTQDNSEKVNPDIQTSDQDIDQAIESHNEPALENALWPGK